MVAKAFTVDLNKPLVFQVGHLGEAYDEWVHQPIVSKETPRFFANDTLEFLTCTVWWAIPLIWIPVVSWFVTMSSKLGLPAPQLATTMAAGIIVWTLLEYSLHRFLFHIKTKGYWANTFHYLIHGCHHKHPMDGLRLVFPPAATAVLLLPIWSLIKFLVPSTYAPALFGGGLLGYVMYDCTHYYLHHGKPLKGVSRNLKQSHMHHHFKVQDKGFGITSPFWDKVFGTLPLELAEKKVTVSDANTVVQNFVVDLNKPLVFQVGHLGEAYQEWVHQPIVSKEGPRFFESDFWEFLTRTEWWVIPLVWLPVVSWFVLKATSLRMGHALHEVALMVVFGICIWTLLEYTLHRFLFHIKTKSYWGNTVHYLLHGCHHKHPMDGLRLVFPPAATAVLCFPFYNLVKLLATPSTAPALFGGGLLGYVMYDVTHYYLHHGQPTREVPKNLKKYHLNHHFRIQNKGFGITSSLWDKVFGTLHTSKSAEKSR